MKPSPDLDASLRAKCPVGTCASLYVRTYYSITFIPQKGVFFPKCFGRGGEEGGKDMEENGQQRNAGGTAACSPMHHLAAESTGLSAVKINLQARFSRPPTASWLQEPRNEPAKNTVCTCDTIFGTAKTRE